jgi:hypothetical protein
MEWINITKICFRTMERSAVANPAELAVTTPVKKGKLLELKEKREVLCAGSYGEACFIVFDRTPNPNPWSCDPCLVFVSESGEACSDEFALPNTRHFLGAEAYIEEGIFVAANFNDINKQCSINIYVYSVSSEWNCKLHNTITCNASQFTGSGLTGNLNSLNAHSHAVVFADFANVRGFSVMTADLRVTSGGTVQAFKHRNVVPPGFQDLDELFFLDEARFYGARVQRVGLSLPLITLAIVASIGASYRVLFEKVIALPCPLPSDGGHGTLSASVAKVRCAPLLDGSVEQVCLVRVKVPQVDDRSVRVVMFLVNLHTQEVVDVCEGEDIDSVEFIAACGTHIVSVKSG